MSAYLFRGADDPDRVRVSRETGGIVSAYLFRGADDPDRVRVSRETRGKV